MRSPSWKGLALCVVVALASATSPPSNTQEVFTAPVLRPLANPDVVFVAHHWRIMVLTARLIRMEYSPSSRYEDAATQLAWYREFPKPIFDHRVDDDETLHITTYVIDEVTGEKKMALRLALPTDTGDVPPTIYVAETDKTWAFGPKFNTTTKGNLGGTARTLDNADGSIFKARYLRGPVSIQGFYDAMRSVEGDWPSGWHVDLGLVSRDGYALLEDTRSPLYVDGWPAKRVDRGKELYFDMYFFGHGLDYKGAIVEYYELSGYPPVLPNFALGVWWSRWYPYVQQDIIQIANDFEAHGVPLSVMVLDMDWHTAGKLYRDTQDNIYWAGYTFNLEMFPDPKGLFDYLHSKNIKNCLNLHPAGGISPVDDAYPQVAKLAGRRANTGKPIRFDPTSKRFIEVYFDQIIAPLERMGVDVFWNDWQQGMAPNKLLDPTESWNTTIHTVDPMWWVNHVFSLGIHDVGKPGCKHAVAKKAVPRTEPGWLDWITGGSAGRPPPPEDEDVCPPAQRYGYGERVIVSRFCGRGAHRYPIGFSGDTFITWESIQFQVGFTVRSSNVGYDWWSHDIGGYQDFNKASLWRFLTFMEYTNAKQVGEKLEKALQYMEENYDREIVQFARDTLAATMARADQSVLSPTEIADAKHQIRVMLSNIDAELFARWAQLGVFSPVFRMHSNQETDRRPWLLREPFQTSVLSSLKLRNQLLPYLEQASKRHHSHGDALVMPLYFERALAAVEDAYKFSSSQYFFGPALMVAPFTTQRDGKGNSELRVWMPHAVSPAGWRSFFTGAAVHREKLKVIGGIHDVPVYVRGGAVVPIVELDKSLDLRWFAGSDNETARGTYHTEVPHEGWIVDVKTTWALEAGRGHGSVVFKVLERGPRSYPVTLTLWDDGGVNIRVTSPVAAALHGAHVTSHSAGLPMLTVDIAALDGATVSFAHVETPATHEDL